MRDSKGAWGVYLNFGLKPYSILCKSHPHVVDRLMELYEGPVVLRWDGMGGILRRRKSKLGGFYWEVRRQLGVELEPFAEDHLYSRRALQHCDYLQDNADLCQTVMAEKSVMLDWHDPRKLPIFDPSPLGMLAQATSWYRTRERREAYQMQRIWNAVPPKLRAETLMSWHPDRVLQVEHPDFNVVHSFLWFESTLADEVEHYFIRNM